MEKIILAFFGFMFLWGSTYGQNTFYSTPDHLYELKTSPSNPDILDPNAKWMIIDTDKDSTLDLNGINTSKLPIRPKLNFDIDNAKGNLSAPSNMPIIDLSKGFSSNLPIKKFPENFPSNMPILDISESEIGIILPKR